MTSPREDQPVTTRAQTEPATGDESPGRRPRRPYHPPRLECHGRLAELTQFGGSQILDSGGGLGNQAGSP